MKTEKIFKKRNKIDSTNKPPYKFLFLHSYFYFHLRKIIRHKNKNCTAVVNTD